MHYVNVAITAVIVFGASFVPGVGVVSDYGMTIAGIFIGLIYGYCTIGMVIPTFMALVALGFSGYAPVPDVLKMSFGCDTVLYIIAILLLSAMLEQCKLSDKLVSLLVGNKRVKGHPWAISIMFMLAAYVAALFINAVPAVIICWTLLGDLFERAGYKLGDRWPIMMMLGTMYTATIAACVPSFQISIASNYGLLKAVSQGTMNFDPLAYMGWSLICSVFLFAAYLLYAKFFLRPDFSKIVAVDLSSGVTQGFTRDQKITGVLFVVFALGLLLPSVLSDGDIVKEALGLLGNSGWGLLIVLLALLIQSGGKPLYEFGAVFSKGVIWDIVLMLATVFTLVGAITEDRTGLSQLIVDLVAPMQASMSPLAFLAVVVLVYALLANLTNTVAVSCIFIPVLYILTQGVGFNMLLFVGITVFISNVSFLMPSATVMAVMIYSQKKWIPSKHCVVFAVFSMVVVYLVMMLVGAPLANVFMPM